MTAILARIITDVLTALYQPFWFAVLSTVLVMFLYLYSKEHGEGKAGFKAIMVIWRDNFLHERTFQRLCALSFYTVMILFRTLLNRDLWINPLSNIMGGWILTDTNGVLTAEAIENLMLFVPFSILLMWTICSDKKLCRRILRGCKSFWMCVWISAKIVFLFSLSIECLQLFLRLGTFQLSDLVYNTFGGMLGGAVYGICSKPEEEERKCGKRIRK